MSAGIQTYRQSTTEAKKSADDSNSLEDIHVKMSKTNGNVSDIHGNVPYINGNVSKSNGQVISANGAMESETLNGRPDVVSADFTVNGEVVNEDVQVEEKDSKKKYKMVSLLQLVK